MPDNISVVPISRTACQPFKLEVMVFSPEAGFKFDVSVERSCTKATATDPAKAIWKLVFDLFKKVEDEDELVKIVHVSYTAENEAQAKKIQATSANGVNSAQADHLVNVVHPAVKKAENLDGLSPEAVDKRAATRRAIFSTIATRRRL